jgi:UPF0176 protein
MMQILNIAGYKFVTLTDLALIQAHLLAQAIRADLKGTILLSYEGINIFVAGQVARIADFRTALAEYVEFRDIDFRESFSAQQPFKHMRVKIKKEIITLKQPAIKPQEGQAPTVTPVQLKQWLDEKRDITLLDTRNDYEVRFGTFHNAQHLHINDFSEFPQAATQLPTDKPIVMFCTGGIRCEKAALQLLQNGFAEVYQLQGGILNYFAMTDGAHYDGECFVFDKRISIDHALKETATQQCPTCEGPIASATSPCPNHLI